MAIPNQANIGLEMVITELGLSKPRGLVSCFSFANPDLFDPLYEGSKDRLSNWRNYGGSRSWQGTVSDHASIWYSSIAGWTTTRSSSTGTVNTTHPPESWVNYSAGRYYIYRWFLTFDLSDISSSFNSCSAATLAFEQTSTFGSSIAVACLNSTHGDTIIGADFNNFTFSNYAMSATQTTYTGSVGCGSPTIREITASSTQRAAITNSFGGKLKMVLINAIHDNGNSAPASKQGLEGWSAGEHVTGCIDLPQLSLTYAA